MSLLYEDHDGMARMISNISNDSIRQLIKIASIGVEEQLSLDEYDLSDICEAWDVPLATNFSAMDWQSPPPDLQMEVDAMRQQLHQDMEPEFGEIPDYSTPLPSDRVRSFPGNVGQAPRESRAFGGGYDDRLVRQNLEQTVTPGLDVQQPRINLELSSNVVRLEPTMCPKPAVTVLPSQVIHTPGYSSPSLDRSSIGLSEMQGYSSEYMERPYDWTSNYGMISDAESAMYNTHPPRRFPQDMQNAQMSTMNGEFSRMMMESEDPFMVARSRGMAAKLGPPPVGMSQAASLDLGEALDGHGHSGKVVRKNSVGEKIPISPFPRQPLESQSAELRKIEGMTEADICDYVKSMAPQLQNHALEEVVRETNFEERLRKAEQKMQEHNQEMENIRSSIANGTMDNKTGQDLLRKVYNRREAAASRTKREEILVKAAIKKRTLEKICSWMREHLFGNSDLFRTASHEGDVRRSRSDGTRVGP